MSSWKGLLVYWFDLGDKCYYIKHRFVGLNRKAIVYFFGSSYFLLLTTSCAHCDFKVINTVIETVSIYQVREVEIQPCNSQKVTVLPIKILLLIIILYLINYYYNMNFNIL